MITIFFIIISCAKALSRDGAALHAEQAHSRARRATLSCIRDGQFPRSYTCASTTRRYAPSGHVMLLVAVLHAEQVWRQAKFSERGGSKSQGCRVIRPSILSFIGFGSREENRCIVPSSYNLPALMLLLTIVECTMI